MSYVGVMFFEELFVREWSYDVKSLYVGKKNVVKES